MANPAWGVKRICPSCGTRYYDFGKPLGEIKCPKCSTEFDPEAFLKTRRARTVAVVEKEVAPLAADEIDPDAETEEAETEEIEAAEVEGEEEEEGAAAEGEEEEEEEVIEDASELGEDEDDMAEVIENVDDEEEH